MSVQENTQLHWTWHLKALARAGGKGVRAREIASQLGDNSSHRVAWRLRAPIRLGLISTSQGPLAREYSLTPKGANFVAKTEKVKSISAWWEDLDRRRVLERDLH